MKGEREIEQVRHRDRKINNHRDRDREKPIEKKRLKMHIDQITMHSTYQCTDSNTL